jgi:hypothetical protein
LLGVALRATSTLSILRHMLRAAVDTYAMPIYIQSLPMSVSKIQSGQLWKKNESSEVYLVTRVYNEALSTVAMLRKSGAESEPLIRVKVERTAKGQNLPGFTPAQEEDKF